MSQNATKISVRIV